MYCKTFEQLTTAELYAILKLRQDVFIIEQNSIYPDLDNEDQQAVHYLEYDPNNRLILYARHRLDNAADEVKIERVVLAPQARGKGQGKGLIESILHVIKTDFPEKTISLSSQVSVSKFYRSLGFCEQGEPYDDGGIEHIRMVLQN